MKNQKCHFCGIKLTPKNWEYKEVVDTNPDKGETAPICDSCWQEKSHEDAVKWCMEHCRPIFRGDL